MKRISLLFSALILLVTALPAAAQQNDPELIALNDALPAIEVMISLPPNTTGAISLDIVDAVVQLTDVNGAVVFTAADNRLHGLQFNIAPNMGTHTLTAQRLPEAAEAYVRVNSLPDMTIGGEAQAVEGNSLTLNQETAFTLDANNPGSMVTVDIPINEIGMVTATFPNANAATQLLDNDGVLLAESFAGHVDGLTFVLDAGSYTFTVWGENMTEPVVAGVRTVAAIDGGFELIEVPVLGDMGIIEAETGEEPIEDTGIPCTATIAASSVNLRSGPGTGYSVLTFGYRGESFPVGGRNVENNWVVIGLEDGGSAWVSRSVSQLDGSCSDLVVFNQPLRHEQPAPVIVVTPEPEIIIQTVPAAQSNGGSSGGGYHDDDDDEHEHESDDDD